MPKSSCSTRSAPASTARFSTPSPTSIQRLHEERGYTFCMIEHDMDFIGRLCDPVIVMAEGRLLMEGTIDEVKNNKDVIEAYLGTGRKHERIEAG
jgi:branched-chain amino acid transport system ATP-binding protein